MFTLSQGKPDYGNQNQNCGRPSPISQYAHTASRSTKFLKQIMKQHMSNVKRNNRPSSIFSYDRAEILDPTTGRVRYYDVTLTVSFFPYKKGVKFDSIEIDIIGQKFIAQRKGKRLAYNLIFQISTEYLALTSLTNAKPTN